MAGLLSTARRRALAVTIAAAALTVPLVATPAAAQVTPATGGFHNYAVGFDLTHGPYDGIGVTRNDISVAVGSAGDCATNPFGDPVVYQSQWVQMLGNAGDWEELGTSHRCNHDDFWYWGYGLNGGWYPIGTVNGSYIGAPARHRFSIYRDGAYWHYGVDTTDMGHDTWDTDGTQISFGLESYDPNASIVGSDYSAISFLRNGVSNIPISGREGANVGTNMCGTWGTGTDTVWWGGEGGGCGYGPAQATPNVTSTPAVTGQVRAGGGLTTAQVDTTCGSGAVRNATGAWGVTGSVVRAYGSTAAAVRDWKNRSLAAAGKALDASQADASGPVIACVIAGNYDVPAPPSVNDTYNLAVVTVDSHGTVTPFAYGNATTLAALLNAAPAAS